MKLFTCAFLVLVILEEYQCDACYDSTTLERDMENKLGVGLGLTTETMIGGETVHKQENGLESKPSYPQYKSPPYWSYWLGDRPSYLIDFPHHGYPFYRQNELDHRLSYPYPLYYSPYPPYYPPSMYPSHRTPYFTYYGRPLGATYNIPYGRQGGASDGTPQYGTPYHQGSFRPQYDRPQHGTVLYPTPFGTAHVTPIVAPLGSPNGTPYGSPNGTPLGSPNGTPYGSSNGTPYGSSNGTPYGSPNGTPYGSPNGTPFGSPNGTPFGSPNGTPYGSPNGTPYGSPNGTPYGSSNGTPYGSPNGTPFGSPNGTPYGSLLEQLAFQRLLPSLLISQYGNN